jgi:hypothetical protein
VNPGRWAFVGAFVGVFAALALFGFAVHSVAEDYKKESPAPPSPTGVAPGNATDGDGTSGSPS